MLQLQPSSEVVISWHRDRVSNGSDEMQRQFASSPHARRELRLSDTPPSEHRPIKSARMCRLLTTFNLRSGEAARDGSERRNQARAKVGNFAKAPPSRQQKDVFGPSKPPKLERETASAAQHGLEAVLEQQQMLLEILEKRFSIIESKIGICQEALEDNT